MHLDETERNGALQISTFQSKPLFAKNEQTCIQ